MGFVTETFQALCNAGDRTRERIFSLVAVLYPSERENFSFSPSLTSK